MKKLLNTLFVTTEDIYLAEENENVVLYRKDKKVGQFPLHILDNIITFAYPGASGKAHIMV